MMLKKLLYTTVLATGLTFAATGATLAENYTTSQDTPRFEETELNTQLSINGNATDISEGGFILQHGDENIPVDFENLAASNLPNDLTEGDMVTVNGVVEDPWLGPKQIIASEVTIERSSKTSATTVNPDTGNTVAGELTVEEQFNYATQEDIANATLISGEVVGIQGRELLVNSENGPVSIDTIAMVVDPAGEYVTPTIEKGDQVQILASSTQLPGEFNAQRIEAIKKSYSDRVYGGQALTLDGVDFIEGQKTAALMMETNIQQK